MGDARRVYVVARVGWIVAPRGEYTRIHQDARNVAGEDRRFVPVAAFVEREAAEARVSELELEAARVFNPQGSWSRAPGAAQIARLADLVSRPEALPAPESHVPTWSAWWDEHAPTWPDETLVAAWKVLLGDYAFYTILEVDTE